MDIVGGYEAQANVSRCLFQFEKCALGMAKENVVTSVFSTSLSNQHVTDRAIDNTSDLGHITSSITTHQSFQSTSSTITPVYKSKFEQRHNYYNSKTSNQH
ncbi:uncharacterized protein [Rutidosis leptorrhynchoides]|uniref:uncharacterized protein isoform X2 n=2 Tax=Rutidosis leptorrhynchoides TaxID=125765 RepID=UPI003A9A42FA